jgi:hypothetical protein
MKKKLTRTPPWNNYIMQKYGASIRNLIFEAYYNSFVKAIILAKKETSLDKLVKELPEDKWIKE